MKKFSFPPKIYLNLIKILFLMTFMMISCSQKPVSPSGEITKWEDVGKLYTRSYSEMDARKYDVELYINMSRSDIKLGDTLDIEISLKNRTSTNIVVYSLDAMPVFGEENEFPYGIELILISKDSGERVVVESYLSFPQFLPPSPDMFSVLSVKGSQTLILSITDLFPSMSAGNYSIQVAYKNESDFGAEVNNKAEQYFIDYDAWIGTTFSNIESFQIVP